MAKEYTVSVYGFFPDPEWEKQRQEKVFLYFKARIDAEKINPEPDYDLVKKLRLAKEIMVADLSMQQRAFLADMLDIFYDENED